MVDEAYKAKIEAEQRAYDRRLVATHVCFWSLPLLGFILAIMINGRPIDPMSIFYLVLLICADVGIFVWLIATDPRRGD